MSKVWGPMGWITLHSIAACYPDVPSSVDKINMSTFLDLFTDTITCRFCKDHFIRIRNTYRSKYPTYLNSKRDFFIFTLRAHNEVNQSLDKPVIPTVADTLVLLNNITKITSAETYKNSYVSYLIRTWAHEMTGDALIYKGKAINMRDLLSRIDLTNGFNINIEEDDITSFRSTHSSTGNSVIDFIRTNAKVGFSRGKLKLF